MSRNKHEVEFEDYLAGDSALSASYRQVSSEQPSAHLDDAILAASRRAVKARPRYAFSPFASDWHVPLSLAAVLVLSLTVVVTVQKERDENYQGAPAEFSPETTSGITAESFSAADHEAESVPIKGRVKEKKDAPKTEMDSVLPYTPIPSPPSLKIPDKMKPAGQSTNLVKKEEMVVPVEKRLKPMFADTPVTVMPDRSAYAAKPADIPLLPKQRPLSKVAEEVKTKTNVRMEQLEENKLNVPLHVMGSVQKTPEDWLVLIRQLWIGGRTDEAVQELKLFYKQYPDYPGEKVKQNLDQDLINRVKTGR